MNFLTKLIVDGKEYDSISYDNLQSSSTSNESMGYVPGETEVGDMFAVCVFAIIVVF